MTELPNSGLDTTDHIRLERLLEYLTSKSTHDILSALLGPDHPVDGLHFDHGAIMLFPADPSAMQTRLAAAGFTLSTAVPSVIVQRRFCSRHELEPEACRIHLLHARRGAQRLEIFYPLRPPEQHAVADERRYNRETHFAFTADHPDPALRERALAAGMLPDGGGFNPHEHRYGAGCSAFYFTAPTPFPHHPWPRRLELCYGGRHQAALTDHCR